MDVYSIIALVIYCLFLGFAIFATLIYGWGDFGKMKMRGPYQVGHKDIHCSKDGVAASVYYPMDRDTYKEEISQSGRNAHYMRYGYKSRLGLAKITAPWGTDDHSHPFLMKWIDGVKMDIVQDGTLAKNFREKSGDGESERPPEQLIPVILCHGLTGSRTT